MRSSSSRSSSSARSWRSNNESIEDAVCNPNLMVHCQWQIVGSGETHDLQNMEEQEEDSHNSVTRHSGCAKFLVMAEHDLTQKIIPFLDRHLAFPLLDHLGEAGIFPEEQLWEAQYQLASGTNMIDYAQEIFRKLHPPRASQKVGDPGPRRMPTLTYLARFFRETRGIYHHASTAPARGANCPRCDRKTGGCTKPEARQNTKPAYLQDNYQVCLSDCSLYRD